MRFGMAATVSLSSSSSVDKPFRAVRDIKRPSGVAADLNIHVAAAAAMTGRNGSMPLPARARAISAFCRGRSRRATIRHSAFSSSPISATFLSFFVATRSQ
jgi:hypothetical protein